MFCVCLCDCVLLAQHALNILHLGQTHCAGWCWSDSASTHIGKNICWSKILPYIDNNTKGTLTCRHTIANAVRAHPTHRTCTHINSIWKWHWASVWTALTHSVLWKIGKSPALAMRSFSTAAGWPGDQAAVQLSGRLMHTFYRHTDTQFPTADTIMQIHLTPPSTLPLSTPKSPIKCSCF